MALQNFYFSHIWRTIEPRHLAWGQPHERAFFLFSEPENRNEGLVSIKRYGCKKIVWSLSIFAKKKWINE